MSARPEALTVTVDRTRQMRPFQIALIVLGLASVAVLVYAAWVALTGGLAAAFMVPTLVLTFLLIFLVSRTAGLAEASAAPVVLTAEGIEVRGPGGYVSAPWSAVALRQSATTFRVQVPPAAFGAVTTAMTPAEVRVLTGTGMRLPMKGWAVPPAELAQAVARLSGGTVIVGVEK